MAGNNTFSATEAFADISAGVTRTLETICEQLIERDLLSRELLVADLVQTQAALVEQGVGPIGRAVPGLLSVTLQRTAAARPPGPVRE